MPTTFPSGKTCFLVIHGIGEQNPFETLDQFGRGIINNLGIPKEQIVLSHEVAKRTGANKSQWTESFLRIQPSAKTDGFIDVHEYYWAYLTEDAITVAEIYDWVKRTLRASRSFYKDHPEKKKDLRDRRGLKPLPIFWLWLILLIVRLIDPLFRMLNLLITHVVPFLVPLREWLKDNVFNALRKIIVGYVGDVAIYTTMDKKSKHFRLRERILAESLAFVDDLLTNGDAGKNQAQYEKVIIAGHSLGSVIAFDTLNHLNIRANVEKQSNGTLNRLTGLITFGSPLDKIAFFFRDEAKRDAYVRKQILRQLHSFKSLPPTITDEMIRLVNPIEAKLDGIPWRNYYHPLDPISGFLDFYLIGKKDNCRLEFDSSWGIAHIGYWKDPRFYADIIQQFVAVRGSTDSPQQEEADKTTK